MAEPIRTYKRRSRMTAGQAAALAAHSDDFLLPFDAPWPLAFAGPDLVLEIGFGLGESTVQLAQAQPELSVLAVDLHKPGIARLMAELHTSNVDCVRVMEADALALLRERIPDSSLAGVRIFFPDPWPKARHHKRRLLTPTTLELLAAKVRPGGFLHFATDWQNYADVSRELLSQSTQWELVDALPYADPARRPLTRFEQRGIQAGRSITDLVAQRR